MEQKSTIDSIDSLDSNDFFDFFDSINSSESFELIKKCTKDSLTLSLQEKDDTVGVEANYCSTFLKPNGFLAQGEFYNLKSHERNAVVTICDPKNAEVKGGNFEFCIGFFAFYFVLVCGVTPKVGPSQQTRIMCTLSSASCTKKSNFWACQEMGIDLRFLISAN